MLNSNSFLAVDFGAMNLKIAEFEPNEAGGLRLTQYGIKSLGQEGLQEANREASMLRGLQELLAEKNYSSRTINVCAPGFHVFSKFVKLPPVDTSKVTQIIQYEAQQNVPFPLEEVVWDYQILGAAASGELEVLLVAIKADVVEGLFRTCETAGLKLQLVDVSTAALCNAFRYNYGDLEGCTLLLDVGARTSNLLFFEKGNIFSRSITIGANSITQDFAREQKLTFEDAESLKLNEGFVSLGGAYEEPDNPNQAAVSKIARQVMTRLHIQVNQTIQYYRGQQGGSPPQRLFLAGGATSMPYTAQFFSEKLNLPVDYFNPFRNIQIDPQLNLEELAKVAHGMGEVVGLGLRNLAHCPVELNLMPKSSRKRRELSAKKSYLIATLFALLLILFAFGWFYEKIAGVKEQELQKIEAQVGPMQVTEQTLRTAVNNLNRGLQEADQLTTWLEQRGAWNNLLIELRQVLLDVEAKASKQFETNAGVWIERFVPAVASSSAAAGAAPPNLMPSPGAPPPPPTPGPPGGRGRLRPPRGRPAAGATPGMGAEAEAGVGSILLHCRAVSLREKAANADITLAFMLEAALKTHPLFEPTTGLVGNLTPSPDNLTFTFQVTLNLKAPLSL